jgi:hypothetical protein
VRGRVVTAAALHPQSARAHLLPAHHAAYLVTVKDNQPRVRAALAAYVPARQATARGPPPCPGAAGALRRAPCRPGRRTRLHAYLRASFPCPGIAPIAHRTRPGRTGTTTRSDTVYLIPSLPPRQAAPARLLALIGGHWSVQAAIACGT